MPPKKNLSPFRSGKRVYIKKQKCPGRIISATAAKTWNVEILHAKTGKPIGATTSLKSQQMKNLTPTDFPFLEREAQNIHVETVPSVSDEEDGFEVVVDGNNDDDEFIPTENSQDNDDEVIPTENDRNTGNNQDKDDDGWDFINADDDLNETEDFPFFPKEDGDEDTFTPNDAAASHGIELDEDKHKAKWETYLLHKQSLIDSQWTVVCKPPKQDGINMGVRVQERSGQKRKGVVLYDDRDEFKTDGPPLWGVLFEDATLGEAERKVESTKLKRLRDKRVFEWKIVSDSSPDRPPTPFQEHGVIGFDFNEFEPAKIHLDEGDPHYNFPFLRLLEHLWPGNWRDHLHNLNCHIERENSAVVRNRTKKTKRLVSGMLLEIFCLKSPP